MSGRVGLKEIAASLRIDVSTVSRALRGDARVAPATAERVRAAAQALQYRPNAAARALRGGRTDRVAVLLSPPQRRFASPIFLELLATLDQRLRASGRSLAVFAARSRDEEPDIVRTIVEDRLADALVLGRTRRADPRVALLLDAGVPFVTFGRTDWPGRHPVVEIDYAEAGRLAVEALAAAEPDALDILTAPEGLLFADNYLAGARTAAEALGLPPPRVLREEMTEAAAEAAAPRILADRARRAVACIQDSLAFGLYRAAAAAGVGIGRDVAVFGGQDFPGGEHAAPPLSTFSTEDAATAELLARVTIERLDADAGREFETHVVRPRAILRASHRLPGPAPA